MQYQQPSTAEISALLKQVNLSKADPGLYDETAESIAKIISGKDKNKNKNAQIRQFYDELAAWNDRIRFSPDNEREDRFQEALPLIRMIRAKAAYALYTKDKIDQNFYELISTLIKGIRSPETLARAKLFFEAVIGFRKEN